MKYFYLILFSILSLNAIGQSYSTVHSNQTVYFAVDSSYFSFRPVNYLKFDSVKVNGSDTILYPKPAILFHQFHEWTLCMNNDIDRWAYKIIKTPQKEIFIDYRGDSVFIEHSRSIGESWNMKKLDNGNQIVATVLSIESDSIWGDVDSLKSFSIEEYDSLGNLLSQPYSGDTFSIYKNLGWKIAPIFNGFPNTIHYELVGHQNLKKGLYNFTLKEAYDMEIGTELHTKDYHPAGTTTYERLHVLKKLDINDSIRLTYKRKKVIKTFSNTGIPQFTYHPIDTITKSYYYGNPFDAINKLPSEFLGNFKPNPFIHDFSEMNVNQNFSAIPTYTNNALVKLTHSLGVGSSFNDTCYRLVDFHDGQDMFVKGFGGKYYVPFAPMTSYKLIYGKNSTTEIGTPEPLLVNTEPINKADFNIYPNPTSTFIVLDLEIKQQQFQIINQLGQVVQTGTLSNNQIDIQQLPKGQYHLLIKDKSSLSRTSFVKI